MTYECRDICFSYDGRARILDDFSRVFPRGVSVLKGFSGCGKTTLLKILAGYLKPDSGTLIPPVPAPPRSREFRRAHVSYMFQGLNLLPLLTIGQNLALCAEIALIPKKIQLERRERLLTELGLAGMESRRASALSVGQQQRAALARTLIKKSEILLFDEPTSGLDDRNTDVIKAKIREAARESVCIVSTHDARLLEIADEIVEMGTAG